MGKMCIRFCDKHLICIISSFLQNSPKTGTFNSICKYCLPSVKRKLSFHTQKRPLFSGSLSLVFGREPRGSGAQKRARFPRQTGSSRLAVCRIFALPGPGALLPAPSAPRTAPTGQGWAGRPQRRHGARSLPGARSLAAGAATSRDPSNWYS